MMKTQLPLILLLGITSALAAPKVDVDAPADIGDVRDLLPDGAGDATTHTTTFSKSVTITSDGNRTVKKTVIDRNGEREESTETTDGEGDKPGKAEAKAEAKAGKGAARIDGDFKGASLESLLDDPDVPESMKTMIRDMLEQLRGQGHPDRDAGKGNEDRTDNADDE